MWLAVMSAKKTSIQGIDITSLRSKLITIFVKNALVSSKLDLPMSKDTLMKMNMATKLQITST